MSPTLPKLLEWILTAGCMRNSNECLAKPDLVRPVESQHQFVVISDNQI